MGSTIKDIAKVVNVSHTTVSRALNNSDRVKPETKEKILAAARRLNYAPNYSAKSLVQNRSYSIGLFFSTFSATTEPHFLFETLRGVKEAISSQYDLVVDAVDSLIDFNGLRHQKFDGIIVMSQTDADDPAIAHAVDHGIPVVVLNRLVSNPYVLNIVSTDRQGSRDAVIYLIDRGYTDIAILTGYRPFGATQERLGGYLEALADRGIAVNQCRVIEGDFTAQSAHIAVHNLLQEKPFPSAIFCCNDMMAIGALKAVAETGLSVPDNLALVGFDDNGLGKFLSPGLTTVRRHLSEMAKVATEQLLAWIEKSDVQAGKRLYIPTEFVPRDSVLPSV